MDGTHTPDLRSRAVYERVRLLLYAADLPIYRLRHDVAGIERFLDGPHQKLVREMPPLTPVAHAIVHATVATHGERLLFDDGAAPLKALIRGGPVTFARAAILIGEEEEEAPLPPAIRDLVTELNSVFERFPETGFAQAKQALSAMGLGQRQ